MKMWLVRPRRSKTKRLSSIHPRLGRNPGRVQPFTYGCKHENMITSAILARAGTGVHFVALTDRRGLVFITTEGHQKT